MTFPHPAGGAVVNIDQRRRRHAAPPIVYGPAGRDQELAPHRLLTCTGCRTLVAVLELPEPFIDPASYRCADCHTHKEG